jgi:phosphate:Na+ symporter
MENTIFPSLIQAAGGLGIFLLGMTVMTDGLKALAGGTIHSWLMRFTKSPFSGAVTGALATSILQSSSATTVAAVGFVAAGLMDFSQALGIVFGANVGTTVTGWIVALFGFEYKITALAMPLVLAGMLMKLLSKGFMSRIGFALAGFGLIFVGLDLMQEGMEGFRHLVSFDHFPADTWYNRLKLLLLGMVFTLITQSSSAGVAATLAALYVDLLTFEQAAALVVGMDVATAVTAVIASIGSSVQARRTGFSHLVYNLLTGIVAFVMITPYTIVAEWLFPGIVETNAEIALVAFHTLFNLVGVALILPFARRFAHLMEWLIPERLPSYLRKLDRDLLKDPDTALDAIFETLHDMTLRMIDTVMQQLDPKMECSAEKLEESGEAIEAIYDYIDDIHLEKENRSQRMKLLEMIHALDHLQTLYELCTKRPDFSGIKAKEMAGFTRNIRLETGKIKELLEQNEWEKVVERMKGLLETMDGRAGSLRAEVIEKIAENRLDTDEAGRYLDLIEWMKEVVYHLARMVYHIRAAAIETAGAPDAKNGILSPKNQDER